MGLTIKTLAAARKKDPIKFNRTYNKVYSRYKKVTGVGAFGSYPRKEGERINYTGKQRTTQQLAVKRLRKMKRAAGATAHALNHAGIHPKYYK